MRCPFCGNENREQAFYCGKCGSILKSTSNKKEQQKSTENIDFNELLAPQPFEETKNQQQTVSPSPPQQQEDTIFESPNSSNKKLKKPIVIITALLITVIVLAIYFISAFSGPMVAISNAVNKTLNSKSFSFNTEIHTQDQKIQIDGTIVIDTKNRKLELFAQAFSDGEETVTFIIKDGILIQDDRYTNTINIKKELDTFFDKYEKYKAKKINDETNWKELFEKLGISDQVDHELFGEAIKEFARNLNDEDYINDKLGKYSKEKKDGTTYYKFNLKAEDIAEELVCVFGNAFKFDENFTHDMAKCGIEEFFVNATGGNAFELDLRTKSRYFTGFALDTSNYYLELKMFDFDEAEIDENIFEKYKDYISTS